MSHMHLARLINNVYPKVAARLVANACAANPIALAIPCHRVISTNGQRPTTAGASSPSAT
jgi:methylated-DNA-[protein]-cysteine S-methyltransferase/AraC family transcriptional regulator of adaptative response/methylated-DNA-[protein]-cysteine methyltransferase